MAPSPAAGKPQTGTPKTPTKLARKPGQTPQKSTPQKSTPQKLGQSASASKPAPSTPKAPQTPKNPTDSPKLPSRPAAGDKAEVTAGNAKDAASGAAAKTQKQPETPQTVPTNEDNDDDVEDENEDDEDDEGPMSKVTDATQKPKKGLQSAAPEPIDDDEDDAVEGAQDQTEETAQDAESQGEDIADDATEKAGDTIQSADDESEKAPSKQQQTKGGKSGKGLLSGAQGLAGKATGIVGKGAKDSAAKAKEPPTEATEGAEESVSGATDAADDATEEGKKVAGEGTDEAGDEAGDEEDEEDQAEHAEDGDEEDGPLGDAVKKTEGAAEQAGDLAKDAKDDAGGAVNGAKDQAEGAGKEVEGQAEGAGEEVEGQAEDTVNGVKDEAEEATDGVDADETVEGTKDTAEDAAEDSTGEDIKDGQDRINTNDIKVPEGLPIDLSVLKGLEVDDDGQVYNGEGNAVGRLAEGDAEDLAGYPIGDDGEILDDDGDLVGRVELLPETVRKQLQAAQEDGEELPEGADDFMSQFDAAEGQLENGVDEAEEGAEQASETLPAVSILEGLTCQIDGLVYDDEGNTVGRVVDGDPQELQNATLNSQGEFIDEEGNVIGHAEIHEDTEELVEQGVYEPASQTQAAAQDTAEGAEQEGNEVADGAEDAAKDATEEAAPTEIEDQLPGIEALQGKELNEAGDVLDDEGNVLGGIEDEELRQKIIDGELDPQELKVDEEGNVVDEEGNVLGKTELADGVAEKLAGAHTKLDFRILDGKRVNKKGKIFNDDGEEIGELIDGELSECAGGKANDKGEVYNKKGELVGHVRVTPGEAAEEATKEMLEELGELPEEDEEDAEEDAEDAAEDAAEEGEQGAQDVEEETEPQMEEPSLSILDGLKVNKKGQVLNEDGEPIGELTAGELSQCAGKKINEIGEVLDKDGNVIGHVRTLPQEVEQSEPEPAPVSILEGFKVNKKGQVLNEDGEPIGELTSGDLSQVAGKKINEKGEVLDASGNVLGTVRTLPVEGQEEEAPAEEEAAEDEEQEEGGQQLPPLSTLEGLSVNKAGKLIDDSGAIAGELIEGDAKKLSKSGLTVDAEGQFWDNKGHVIGRAQTVPQEDPEQEAPFAGLEGLRVVEEGWVQDDNGHTVGYVTEGDAKKLIGRVVDEDGDIIDKKGSVVGHAERYIPEEEEEVTEEAPDLSFLQGKTCTKQGLVIGDESIPVARVVEGTAKDLAGRKLDDKGQFWNDTGSVIGKVELIPEAEREAKPEGPFAGLDDLRVIEGGKIADEDGNVVGEIVEGNPKRLVGLSVDEDGDIVDKYGNVKGHAEPLPEEEPMDFTVLDGMTLNKQGFVVDESGVPYGKIVEGNPSDLAGRKTDEKGYIYNDTGKVVGRCEPLPEEERVRKPEGAFAGLDGLHVVKGGKVEDENENIVGEITEGDPKRLLGMHVDEDGDIIDKYGNVKGHAEPLPDDEDVDYSILDGLTVNKQGFVVDSEGTPFGRLIEGTASELAGRKCDESGYIYNDTGKVVGKCEPIPENERVARPEGPFAGLEGLRVVKEGKVEDEDGNVVGEITEGDAKRLVGMKVDEDGDIIDKFGNTKGHAEPLIEEEETLIDNSPLEGKYLNKQGYVVDEKGIPFGRLVEGNVSELAGRKCDENGYIYGDTGKVVGKCEVLPENERVARPEGPFAGLEGLRVVKGGYVEDDDGNTVGQITEGDPKKLVGLHVDEDGDIIDKYGNVKGHADPWSEEEQAEADLSALAGTTINKAGYAVDGNGQVLGRVVEGDHNIMVGKKVDGKGQIWDNAGNVIGKAELTHGAGGEEGPFAGFENLEINKDGTVTTQNGDIVGRVIEGDIKKLLGRTVDEDGEILDKNGNSIGKAERWEPDEKERRVNPMSGYRVNKEGEVRDDNGDLLGKLTSGDLGHCVGQEIDDAGNVVDVEGNKIGEVTLMENIAEDEYEGPTEEELEEARKREEEREIAGKMASICSQTLERVQPICKQITDHMEKADATPKDELDEEELVNNVKPLIEEAGRVLQECNGSLRGLDPDGKIAAQAKGRSGTGEATPEEHRLAETLKEITTSVVTTIDNAKKKLNNMPHAKKKLNPLWGLMTQPLFQILAAVGLLLAGVLGLVGQLLNGLGLGGLVNGLLGGLGINKLLSSFGLKDDKKDGKKKGNALSNLPIVGGMLGGK
ncbi:hypothetical protein TI39_contig4304g00006 [Zymoseptoria brevis]|uniref:DUF6987 domain-containing protein n=1 Tax=Zymoseptoria brevis TaxID=1047168 RepID=A0A0F4G857_9PEZI|nr:hypothetical protein TI39_contig4304g00006 [Zymoseptoria brevis]